MKKDILIAPFGYTKAEKRAVQKVMDTGSMAYGMPNLVFEESFNSWLVGYKNQQAQAPLFSVSLGSCSVALELALRAAHIKGGVIVSTFNWVSVVAAVVNAGATPQFVDIDRKTWSVSLELIKAGVDSTTEAILIVHYAGVPVEMDEIYQFAKQQKLFVIEDCAEALGVYSKRVPKPVLRVGMSADVSCFSFSVGKHISIGQGGMLVSRNQEFVDRVRSYAFAGLIPGIKSNQYRVTVDRPGSNLLMGSLPAVVASEQLALLTTRNERRCAIAREYRRRLNLGLFTVRYILGDECPPFFPVKLNPLINRRAFIEGMKTARIETNVYFDPPVHTQPYYAAMTKFGVNFEHAEELALKVVALPSHFQLTERDVEYVANTANQVAESLA